ncbi:hypothetical protein IT570_10745 [Candidatus Sumerlaeota bacterium]|nr:hypothetical protein [Candidatus Sumerlaeota bacterium]
MAVAEKQVPKFLSYGAIIASVIICGVLWAAGSKDPRAYTSGMAFTHHSDSGYGTVACYKCHVPQGSEFGMRTSLTCQSARCHGELKPGMPSEEALAIYTGKEDTSGMPAEMRREVGALFILNHQKFAKTSCMECHTEHKNVAAAKPGDWVSVLPK